MKRNNFLITMAGEGARFKKAGYLEPKYMINANGKTLFQISMESIKHLVFEDDTIVFIVKKSDASKPFILESASSIFRNCKIEVVEISSTTDGQSTTVLKAFPLINKDYPIVIYNIDTGVVEKQIHLTNLDSFYGHIPCFIAPPGEQWSFVEVDQGFNALNVVEKERVSDYATIGLYWFKNAHIYEEAYLMFYEDDKNTVNGEKYIAPMYNWLIDNNYPVSIEVLKYEDVIPLGTPQELNIYLNKTKKGQVK